ncbi:MAG: hypothetical protein JO127_12905 [Caulobacteraceae bacterium]|nr:hypothetical protein [Caulobacteraceae bacterium]
MRLALVSLILLTAAAGAATAQTQPSAATPSQTSAPAASAPATSAPSPTAAAPATPPAAAPAAQPPPAAVEEAPPAPPAPPTDPAAIGVMSVLQSVCIPAANGGKIDQLAKTAGYRKSGDDWSMRQRDYALTIENPGSNPTQCHVQITHAVDAQAPGRPIVVALHDWASTNGWNLYRNDKSVQDGVEYTTRSWTRDGDGKTESLVFMTQRHADGTPMQRNADTSELIYGVTKSGG